MVFLRALILTGALIFHSCWAPFFDQDLTSGENLASKLGAPLVRIEWKDAPKELVDLGYFLPYYYVRSSTSPNERLTGGFWIGKDGNFSSSTSLSLNGTELVVGTTHKSSTYHLSDKVQAYSMPMDNLGFSVVFPIFNSPGWSTELSPVLRRHRSTQVPEDIMETAFFTALTESRGFGSVLLEISGNLVNHSISIKNKYELFPSDFTYDSSVTNSYDFNYKYEIFDETMHIPISNYQSLIYQNFNDSFISIYQGNGTWKNYKYRLPNKELEFDFKGQIVGMIENATQLLVRNSDSFEVYDTDGKYLGGFNGGNIYFCHDRYDLLLRKWYTVFARVLKASSDEKIKVIIEVYEWPSSELQNLFD